MLSFDFEFVQSVFYQIPGRDCKDELQIRIFPAHGENML